MKEKEIDKKIYEALQNENEIDGLLKKLIDLAHKQKGYIGIKRKKMLKLRRKI